MGAGCGCGLSGVWSGGGGRKELLGVSPGRGLVTANLMNIHTTARFCLWHSSHPTIPLLHSLDSLPPSPESTLHFKQGIRVAGGSQSWRKGTSFNTSRRLSGNQRRRDFSGRVLPLPRDPNFKSGCWHLPLQCRAAEWSLSPLSNNFLWKQSCSAWKTLIFTNSRWAGQAAIRQLLVPYTPIFLERARLTEEREGFLVGEESSLCTRVLSWTHPRPFLKAQMEPMLVGANECIQQKVGFVCKEMELYLDLCN